jgi:hypothetical protein
MSFTIKRRCATALWTIVQQENDICIPVTIDRHWQIQPSGLLMAEDGTFDLSKMSFDLEHSGLRVGDFVTMPMQTIWPPQDRRAMSYSVRGRLAR